MTITKHLSLMRLGLVALIAATMIGCGGGGGGGGGGNPPPPPVQGSGINSSFQDGGGSITGVVVNSPPVVKFKVQDSAGNPVTNLTTSNVRLAMAHFVPEVPNTTSGGGVDGITPSRWVALVTRVRDNTCTSNSGCDITLANGTAVHLNKGDVYPDSPDGKGTTYVQGTTDPFGTCSITNLTYDATTAVYTYTFCTNVKTTVDPVTSAVAWDPSASAIYRLGIQLNYTDPVTKKTTRSNPYVDFTVDASGNGNQLKDAGGNQIFARKMVVKESCNECHSKLIAHGSRVDPNYCVMCHNPSSTDNRTANTIDFKQMIHKFHMGEGLTNAYQVQGFVANEVHNPQDPRNCTKCHDNATAPASQVAVHPTPQGDNWMSNPSRQACGACHDNVDFETGTNHPDPGGVRHDDTQCKVCHTPDAIAVSHRTPFATPHNPTPIAGFTSLQYKIVGATVDPVTRLLTIDFQILSGSTISKNGTVTPGTPVALNAYPNAAGPLPGAFGLKPCDLTTSATFYRTGATFKVAYSTKQDGVPSPTDWNMGHDSMYLCEAWAGMNGNTLTVKDAATNTYEVVMAKSTFSVNTTTLVVTNGHSLAVPADAKMVTAVMSDGYALTLAALPAGLSADDAALNGAVPGIPSLFTATGNTPDGKPNVGRRVVMDVGKCNNCHDRLGSHPFFHTGNYATDMGPTVDVSVAMCAICHTPNQGGSTGWSANTRVWVHGIHSANTGIRTVPFTWHGTSPTNNYYTGMTFPGVIQNCAACHFVNADGTTTYDFSDPQYTDALITSMLNVVANTGKKNPAAANAWIFPQQAPIGSGVWAYGIAVDNTTDYGKGYSFDTSGTATNGQVIADATTPNNLVSSPITAACASCHDDIQWTNHMKTMGGQFYDVRGAKQVYTESCLTCHGPGTEWNIKDMHAKSLP